MRYSVCELAEYTFFHWSFSSPCPVSCICQIHVDAEAWSPSVPCPERGISYIALEIHFGICAMPPIRSSSSDGLKVLIFDGGDLRSLSQIEILREYMRRIQFDTGEALRPHQVFDLVAGVGPAGILAFLLGGLGLTIEEASEQFDRLCRDLLLDDQLDTESRTEKLETLLKDMLRTAQIRENQKLCDPSSPACKTKIALYFMSSSNLGRCRVFRNYESRQYEYNPTILEALRATCSMPHLFMPICAGPDHHQEDLVTAMLGYNNPTKEVIRELLSIHGSSWRIQLILSIGAGKQAPLSIKGKGISLVEKAVQEAENVAEELREHLKKTGVYFRFSVDRGIETLEQAQGQQISTIYSSTSTYLSQKDVNESLDSAIKATFMSSLVTLERLNPYPSLVMKSSNGLPPLSAFFVMRQAPIDALVNGLLSVNSDDPRQRIMVVSGMGGSGKTQITLAFARANENWFRHILFVDASSAESIENSLIARGGAVDRALPCSDARQRMFLARCLVQTKYSLQTGCLSWTMRMILVLTSASLSQNVITARSLLRLATRTSETSHLTILNWTS